MLVTDWTVPDLLQRVEAVVAALGREGAVQHRHPGADDRHFLEQARALAAICGRHRAPLFINRRLDVARLVEGHLHLPSTAVQVAEAKAHLPGRWVSHAVHDPSQAQRGADLALLSPVFPPGSKPQDTRPPLGVAGFRALAQQVPCPAFALGGVTLETASQLAGAAGVAVVSAVWHAADPAEAARGLVRAIGPRG
jgi:thiamine-phosphate pyrophosphorylase